MLPPLYGRFSGKDMGVGSEMRCAPAAQRTAVPWSDSWPAVYLWSSSEEARQTTSNTDINIWLSFGWLKNLFVWISNSNNEVHATVKTAVYTRTHGVRRETQTAGHAGFPTAADLSRNFSLTTPRSLLRGDFPTIEHDLGFTISPLLSLLWHQGHSTRMWKVEEIGTLTTLNRHFVAYSLTLVGQVQRKWGDKTDTAQGCCQDAMIESPLQGIFFWPIQGNWLKPTVHTD